MGLDTKTYWLTNRQSQCDFDFDYSSDTRVEARSNTSTVTLRVVGGDEKGSLKSETVKYDCESQETRPSINPYPVYSHTLNTRL
jgi:hypothetical protein